MYSSRIKEERKDQNQTLIEVPSYTHTVHSRQISTNERGKESVEDGKLVGTISELCDSYQLTPINRYQTKIDSS